jgi:DNA-binding LacI/PurR family transcriptional regulator
MKQVANSAPTIFDVARLAGVSRGTVDRVVYGRGRVSAETKERVRKAIEQLGYVPNPNASSLASKKEYRFACLIPSYNEGDYWEEIYKGFIEAAESIQFASERFSEVPEEEREELQRFSLICRLSAEVYMRKFFIERLLDAGHFPE